jgi:hypothetical protein
MIKVAWISAADKFEFEREGNERPPDAGYQVSERHRQQCSKTRAA